MSSERSTEPSVSELVTRMSEQTSRLVRDEMRLAQAEFAEKAQQGGMGAGLFGAGGILAGFGFGALVAAAVLALALVVPAWASALIVAAVLFVAAGVAAVVGRFKVAELTPVPEQTVANVQQDIHEIKEHARR